MAVNTDDVRNALPSLYPNNTSGLIDAAKLRSGMNLLADAIDESIGKSYSDESAGNAQIALNAAIEAGLYDGPKVESFAELTALPSGAVAVGQTVRIVEIGAVVKRLPDVALGDLAHTGASMSWQVLPSQGGAADIRAFGCIMDGVVDDTLAFQAAFDSGMPLVAGMGEIRLTDSIRLPYGASFKGAGGAANYDASPLKIKFDPATKLDLFIWKTAPVGYVFAGVTLTGFCIQGEGPGADNLINLPFLYGGKIDCFAFTGFDVFIRARQWIDTKVSGGAQGFRTYGVHFFGDNVNPSDVTTSTTFDLYLSQGPIAYYAPVRAVTNVKILGVIESVDLAGDFGIGNNVDVTGAMLENVPRALAGTGKPIWRIGKTGSGWVGETHVRLHMATCFGRTSDIAQACIFADIDEAQSVTISGYVASFAALLATTDKTAKVMLNGLTSASVPRLGMPGAIYDHAVISGAAFDTNFMTLDGTGDLIRSPVQSRSYAFWPEVRQAAALDQLLVDKANGRKLTMIDGFGNVSAPVAMLQTSVLTGWTFGGAVTTPGELVKHSVIGLGLPAMWQAMAYGADTALTLTLCSTTLGSAVIGYTGGTAPFFGFKVGDYVTVSAGYASATVQRRIVAVAADLTSITLDSPATATVADTVTITRAAHSLVPVGQQGYRSGAATPVGSVVPQIIGERYLDTSGAKKWWSATGLTSADWV